MVVVWSVVCTKRRDVTILIVVAFDTSMKFHWNSGSLLAKSNSRFSPLSEFSQKSSNGLYVFYSQIPVLRTRSLRSDVLTRGMLHYPVSWLLICCQRSWQFLNCVKIVGDGNVFLSIMKLVCPLMFALFLNFFILFGAKSGIEKKTLRSKLNDKLNTSYKSQQRRR